LNLNYWNNGYIGKTEIWRNVSIAREYLIAYTVMLGENISPLVYLPFVNAPNSTSLLDTLWNYLYIAEGSDWTWQTGPPAYGPSWFKEQALLYTSTITSLVKSQFSMIKVESVKVSNNHIQFSIYNGINHTVYLTVVVKYGNGQLVMPTVLGEGLNKIDIKENNISSTSLQIYLYSPVLQSEIGNTLIPITSYGFLIAQYSFNVSESSSMDQIYIIIGAIALIVLLIEISIRRFIK
ncbi:glycoside hydrolase, partial [Sulfolobus sp. F1]